MFEVEPTNVSHHMTLEREQIYIDPVPVNQFKKNCYNIENIELLPRLKLPLCQHRALYALFYTGHNQCRGAPKGPSRPHCGR